MEALFLSNNINGPNENNSAWIFSFVILNTTNNGNNIAWKSGAIKMNEFMVDMMVSCVKKKFLLI